VPCSADVLKRVPRDGQWQDLCIALMLFWAADPECQLSVVDLKRSCHELTTDANRVWHGCLSRWPSFDEQ
jgi:hypothetical protein